MILNIERNKCSKTTWFWEIGHYAVVAALHLWYQMESPSVSKPRLIRMVVAISGIGALVTHKSMRSRWPKRFDLTLTTVPSDFCPTV